MLDDYELTVVADLGQPDEYVMVPPDHPAARELAICGVEPCGVEVTEPGKLPAVHFGVTSGASVRRLLYWWADWERVAAAQRLPQ
jgi:hypothetical protein